MLTETFKQLGLFVGWLSGSLTGIAAILYGLGYLAIRAHLYSLIGVEGGLLSYDQQEQLKSGVAFIVYSVSLLGQALLYLLLPFLVAAAVVGFYSLANRRLRARARRPRAFDAPHAWRYVAFGLLVLLFVVRLHPALESFMAVLRITDRLYDAETPGSAGGELTAMIRRALAASDEPMLELYYVSLLGTEILAAVTLLAAVYVTAPWRLQLLLVSPFGAALLLFTLLLPMAYGVLRVPAKFSTLSLMGVEGSDGAGTYRLLSKTEREFVLWDPGRKSVVWMPTDRIHGAIFSRGPDEAPPSGHAAEAATPSRVGP